MELEPDSPRRQSREAVQRGSATSSGEANPGGDEQKVVFLGDHLGTNYVFPFELCRSREDTEPLWKEIYTIREQKWLDRINKGEYNIRNKGANILPSVWSAIVRPNVTIQIDFSDLPTFPKIHVRHIDVEKLDLYGIPWKIDVDPEYVIILRELSTYELNMIFEHKRRSRSTRSEKISGDDVTARKKSDETAYEGDPIWRSRSPSPWQRYRDEQVEPADNDRTVTFDIDSPRAPKSRRESDVSSSADSSDSLTSTSDRSIVIIRSESSEPPRDVVAPVDTEGNPLSFQVSTKHVQNLIEANKESGDRNVNQKIPSPKNDVGNSRIETFRITRAMIDETEGRSQIQIHVLPGPENPHLQSSVACTWCHISANELDFTQFRDVCLTMPHLSDRLRKLASEMLKKVDAEKVKKFDGGMFIEPGTVLRADESDQADTQSVIFSCIPYFALQPPSKKSTRTEDNLFPQRTLMQTFYPYEPVRERDEEQSYRRFNEDRSNKIIHVPNLWMMNIGSTHVVTCGHMLLTKEMTNSMTIIEEDIKQLGRKPVTENDVTKIKFTDWGGRDFIFPLGACRSYFQMEAKAREIGYMINNRAYIAKIRLQHISQDGSSKITPGTWKDVVKRTDLLLINIAPVSDNETDKQSPMATDIYATTTLETVPPFFHWPQQITDKADNMDKNATAPDPSSATQPSDYLEKVEKALTTEIVGGNTINEVDKTFTSTDHYKSLQKTTYAEASAEFANLRNQCEKVKKGVSGPTFHQMIIDGQRAGILEKSIEFFDTTRMICSLFVYDTDENDILSKIWGVMVKIREYVVKLESYRPSEQPTDGDTAAKQDDFWLIRPTASPCLVSHPEGSPEFIKSIGRCKRCRRYHSFDTREDALRHLQQHVKPQSESQKLQKVDQRDGLPKDESSEPDVTLDPQAKAWVIANTEFWHEQTNAGVLEILTKATILAKYILGQAQELKQGVENEDGQMSDLYTLPNGIPEAFRQIVVFFMATERALYDAVMAHGKYHRLKEKVYGLDTLPYSERGLEVLENFKGDAIRSLTGARSHLCYMARSNPPIDVTKQLSRGAEYISGWLMRRLLLKPIQNRATISDLYRDYISRLQFQVSHRPSKRLLRDLNLLQEELSILVWVNTQQAHLTRSYLTVLDDATYEKLIPSRQSMFPYERILLEACAENLDLIMEDYEDVIRRCGPLANRTKQSLEINEEDHGKAIMVFTVVTVIFLPLSFATSYLGMNTADIRDMDQKQSLFWTIAIPLTAVTVGACLLIGYNGEEIRDMFMWVYHKATGKQESNSGGTGISAQRRKRSPNALGNSSSTTLESSAMPSELEVIRPRPIFDYSTVPYSNTGWTDEVEDAWYLRRPAKHTVIAEASKNYDDYVPMNPAGEPVLRIEKESRSKLPEYGRMDDYYPVDGRYRRGTHNHYYEPPVNPDYHYNSGFGTGLPPRRSYNRSRPSRPEVPVRQPSRSAYDIRSEDGEANGYRWEKKRSDRSHSRRYQRERDEFFER